jgi:hypothetical protein
MMGLQARAEREPARSPRAANVHASVRGGQAVAPDVGNQAIQHLFLTRAIQAKLTIGQPGDIYEKEADDVADRIMRSSHIPPIQRKCAACAAGTPCPKCEEEGKLHAEEGTGLTPRASAGTESSLMSLRGRGQPLPPSARAFFESRFGADFGGVRVHTDHRAEEAARSIHARAFTAGQDIAFGEGQFAPDSADGKRLLAHELMHTIQQRDGADNRPAALRIQLTPDSGEASIWDTISDAVSSIAEGAASVGGAVLEGAQDVGGAVLQGLESAGGAIAEGAESAAETVVETVASAEANLLALEKKQGELNALLKDYSPLPDGLIRLKDEMLAEKARLLALEVLPDGEESTPLANPVANVGAAPISLLPTFGGDYRKPAAGGCGLCYGTGGKIGNIEAGNAAHGAIQAIMWRNHRTGSEFPLGNGRIDLVDVDEAAGVIKIGEIKPANEGGIDDGIDQIEKRLRDLPAFNEKYGLNLKPVPLDYPVRDQPILFHTLAPDCEIQPKDTDCLLQDLYVSAPTKGLYFYYCKLSYAELKSRGCVCECPWWLRPPLPFPVRSPSKDRKKINWDKVTGVAQILALLAVLIADVVCAFVTLPTIIGAIVCGTAALATAGALVVLVPKILNEPDTA